MNIQTAGQIAQFHRMLPKSNLDFAMNILGHYGELDASFWQFFELIYLAMLEMQAEEASNIAENEAKPNALDQTVITEAWLMKVLKMRESAKAPLWFRPMERKFFKHLMTHAPKATQTILKQQDLSDPVVLKQLQYILAKTYEAQVLGTILETKQAREAQVNQKDSIGERITERKQTIRSLSRIVLHETIFGKTEGKSAIQHLPMGASMIASTGIEAVPSVATSASSQLLVYADLSHEHYYGSVSKAVFQTAKVQKNLKAQKREALTLVRTWLETDANATQWESLYKTPIQKLREVQRGDGTRASKTSHVSPALSQAALRPLSMHEISASALTHTQHGSSLTRGPQAQDLTEEPYKSKGTEDVNVSTQPKRQMNQVDLDRTVFTNVQKSIQNDIQNNLVYSAQGDANQNGNDNAHEGTQNEMQHEMQHLTQSHTLSIQEELLLKASFDQIETQTRDVNFDMLSSSILKVMGQRLTMKKPINGIQHFAEGLTLPHQDLKTSRGHLVYFVTHRIEMEETMTGMPNEHQVKPSKGHEHERSPHNKTTLATKFKEALKAAVQNTALTKGEVTRIQKVFLRSEKQNLGQNDSQSQSLVRLFNHRNTSRHTELELVAETKGIQTHHDALTANQTTQITNRIAKAYRLTQVDVNPSTLENSRQQNKLTQTIKSPSNHEQHPVKAYRMLYEMRETQATHDLNQIKPAHKTHAEQTMKDELKAQDMRNDDVMYIESLTNLYEIRDVQSIALMALRQPYRQWQIWQTLTYATSTDMLQPSRTENGKLSVSQHTSEHLSPSLIQNMKQDMKNSKTQAMTQTMMHGMTHNGAQNQPRIIRTVLTRDVIRVSDTSKRVEKQTSSQSAMNGLFQSLSSVLAPTEAYKMTALEMNAGSHDIGPSKLSQVSEQPEQNSVLIQRLLKSNIESSTESHIESNTESNTQNSTTATPETSIGTTTRISSEPTAKSSTQHDTAITEVQTAQNKASKTRTLQWQAKDSLKPIQMHQVLKTVQSISVSKTFRHVESLFELWVRSPKAILFNRATLTYYIAPQVAPRLSDDASEHISQSTQKMKASHQMAQSQQMTKAQQMRRTQVGMTISDVSVQEDMTVQRGNEHLLKQLEAHHKGIFKLVSTSVQHDAPHVLQLLYKDTVEAEPIRNQHWDETSLLNLLPEKVKLEDIQGVASRYAKRIQILSLQNKQIAVPHSKAKRFTEVQAPSKAHILSKAYLQSDDLMKESMNPSVLNLKPYALDGKLEMPEVLNHRVRTESANVMRLMKKIKTTSGSRNERLTKLSHQLNRTISHQTETQEIRAHQHTIEHQNNIEHQHTIEHRDEIEALSSLRLHSNMEIQSSIAVQSVSEIKSRRLAMSQLTQRNERLHAMRTQMLSNRQESQPQLQVERLTDRLNATVKASRFAQVQDVPDTAKDEAVMVHPEAKIEKQPEPKGINEPERERATVTRAAQTVDLKTVKEQVSETQLEAQAMIKQLIEKQQEAMKKMNIDQIADEVYTRINERFDIERSRRGL